MQESKTKVLLMSKQRAPETEHFASDQTSTAQGISGGPHTVLLLASSHTAWETSRVWCDCLHGKSGQCGHVMALLLLCCDQFQPNAFVGDALAEMPFLDSPCGVRGFLSFLLSVVF